MAIQFIVGPSGTGKTRYIYDKMIGDSIKKDHPPIIFILPEQSNMGAEQDMISLHPNGGTMDISILSFTRLAYELFDKDNVYTADILDDYGKSMLIMKVLKNREDELVYYGSMIGRQGFIDEIKSTISEFYQYQITVDKLDDIINALPKENSLYYKLSDVRCIMSNFEEEMGNTYMVAEQMLSLLSEHVGESEMLQNAQVFFDGFTGFTPIQYDVIGKMMKKCGNLYFTITMDEDAMLNNSYSEYGLFKMGKDTVANLSRLASDNEVSIIPHIYLDHNYRFVGKNELMHIEKNIFRFPVRECVSVENNEVEIIEFDNIDDEILCIGRKIQKMVRDEGYRFRDFAIITGDLDENINVWKRIMNRLEIPFFTDVNEPLVHNNIVEIISMIFELFEKDFSFDTVFSLLKSGFFDIDEGSIYELENYALKYGVHGYSWWSKPFKNNIKGLALINKTRHDFISLFDDIYPVFSKSEQKAIEYIKGLYSFIVRINLGEKLWDQSQKLEQIGDARKARVYEKAYEKLISVLDKTVDILGEQNISEKTLKDMIIVGMSDMKLGILPNTLDQVMIGDMERTRLHHIKVLYVAGANEGLLPKSPGGGGIITDRDRERLKSLNVTISPGSTEKYYIQQFYLYMQMTCGSDKLVISYRKNDKLGNTLNRSFFVKYIMQMFPNKKVINGTDELSSITPFSEDDMFSELSKEFSSENFVDSSLYTIMSESDNVYIDRLISGYLYNNQPGILNDAVSLRLYGNNMIHNVSRLESFSSCQFQFFLQYGLKLKKPEEYTVENNNIGTILHNVMEVFFSELKEKGVEYNKRSFEDNNITEEYISERIEKITACAAKNINETIFDSSYRMRNQLSVLTRIAKRSINNLLRHLEMGEMKPEYFEKRFSPDDNLEYIHMKLSDGYTMDMSGIIDRVDIKETDDAIYVKVIDYKSGSKDIDYVEMVEGRQLQLAVYMSVMLEFLGKKYPDKKIIPSGMYYFQLADKLVDGVDDDRIEKNRIKDSRMTGLVSKDDKCLEYMDHKTGDVVHVTYKDGEPSGSNTHLVTDEELRAISIFTRRKMIDIGDKIIRGQIDMKPRKGDMSPCKFCDYRSVCRFEPGLGGNNYAFGSQYDKEQAKKVIFSEVDNDKE